MVGVDASAQAKGGMAFVVQSYRKYFESLNYVCTWKDKSKAKKLLQFIKAILQFILILSFNHKINLIHIHSTVDSSFKRKSVFIKLSKFYKKKILLHMHGGAFPAYYDSKSISKQQSIIRILNSVDKIAVIVEYPWVEWFKEIGIPEENIVVIHNTIDLTDRIQLPEKNPEIRMIYMGKLNKEKGIYDLLEVLKEHKYELNGKLKLRIAGFYKEQRLVNVIKDYNLNDIVSFEGFLSGNDKKRFLSWGNVLIQPSYFEAQSISILEGMSYNLAILASNVGGIPSIVKNNENGMLFMPGNLNEIWETIHYCVSNPKEIERYGNNGAMMVKDYYPNSTIGKLKQVYSKLLSYEET